ncbi:MAG TPA: winged helix-turn-helix transcriptional regulator [Candidatus Acidoferrales bacterium]|nr:winged helix-turn-helix transcriptional regulator [Candidatus Acidoferrales bacterium]
MVERDFSAGSARRANGASSVSVAAMVESVLGCKWSVRLLRLLADGCTRPSAFLRACPGLSAKVMNERWRTMTSFGIVRRTVLGEKPPVEVEYRLTPFGRRFMRILDEVRRLEEAIESGRIAENGEFIKGSPRSRPRRSVRAPAARGRR